MEADATAVANQKPRAPHLYGKGVSGNKRGRINVRIRAIEVFDSLRPDFGALSATDTLLLKQAAMMIARSESISSVRHADAAIRLSSESRRLLAMLRRHAAKRNDEGSLADLLQQDHAEQRAAADAGPATPAAPVVKDATSDAGKGAVTAVKARHAMAMDAKMPGKPDADTFGLDGETPAALKRGEAV
jgi:hypothetical protein